ncbi:MAG: hypothetical protein ABJP34_06445 [Erythrobacter sp.]
MTILAEYSYPFALLASLLWFSAAFRYWSFQHEASAKLFVPKSLRSSPILPTIAALVRFLGGMNGAFAVLSLALLIVWATGAELFTDPLERGVLLVALAAAHFSQFIFNVPILKNGGRRDESYWDVKTGPMYFIFVVDALEFAINGLAALIQFLV